MTEEINYLIPENRFRATPMDLLKQGLHNRSWEAIEACYVMLGGEKQAEYVSKPYQEAPPGTLQDVKELPVKRKRGRPKKAKEDPKPEPKTKQEDISSEVPT